MNQTCVSADLDNLERITFEGFDRERKFNPMLVVHFHVRGSVRTNKFVIQGYDAVWNFLDTVCWNEPLPRSHFNDVLKHRMTEADHTSEEIILDVIKGSDTKVFNFHVHTMEVDEYGDIVMMVDSTTPAVVDGILRVHPVLNDLTSRMMEADRFTDRTFGLMPIKFDGKIRNLPSVMIQRDVIGNEGWRHIWEIALLPNGNVCYFNRLVCGDEYKIVVTSYPRPLTFEKAVNEQKYLYDVTVMMLMYVVDRLEQTPEAEDLFNDNAKYIATWGDNPIKMYREFYNFNAKSFISVFEDKSIHYYFE